MDIPSALPPVLASVAPVPQAAPAGAGSADAGAALQGLASVILDTSGKASDEDRLAAYNTARQQAVTGQFRGLGPDDRRLLNQIGNSDTAQAVQNTRATYDARMRAAIQQAGASGGSHSQALGVAALAHFDSLPGFPQKLLFSSLNAPDRTGATPFAGLQDWRDQMGAMGGVRATVDRVELSATARGLLGADRPSPAPAQPAYVSGSLASVRV
ncbi:MAG TPA: hypothetical protein VGC92_02530 [Phenylobacterium sp.]|jgi:hypothetical protein